MAFEPLYGFQTELTAAITAGDLALPVPLADAVYLGGIFQLGDFSYLQISDGVNYEIVQVLSIGPGAFINVSRAQEGTNAAAFPTGTCIRFIWTANGIASISGGGGGGTVTAVTGSGLAQVSGGPAVFNVDVDAPNFVGVGINITGAYPNLTWTAAASSGVQSVIPGTDIQISGLPTNPVVGLPLSLASGVHTGPGYCSGIQISSGGRVEDVDFLPVSADGIYANATVTVSSGRISSIVAGGGGGGGTVQSVTAGAGITISGTPTVNPIVSISNTGVVAGTYEGVQINSRGQIAALPLGFGPTSQIITVTPAVSIGAPSTGVKQIDVAAATTSLAGVVELADVAEATNFTVNNRALTPLGFKEALNSVGNVVTAYGFSGPGPAGPALANVVQSIGFPACDSIQITADVSFLDPALGAGNEHDVPFAMNVYVNGSPIFGSPTIPGGYRSASAIVNAGVGGTIELRTTTPVGVQVVQGRVSYVALSNIP